MAISSVSLRNKVLPGLMLSLSLIACGGRKEDDVVSVQVDRERSLGVSWDEFLERARANVGGEPYYVVEGDLVFDSQESLRAYYDDLVLTEKKKLAVFQRISTGFEPTFVGDTALDITYCVSNSFTSKATAIADMATATQAWQDVVNVRFRYIPGEDANCTKDNANVNFALIPVVSASLLGCAANKMIWFAPTDGCPVGGTNVVGVLQLNYGAYPYAAPFNGVTPAGILRHELGHMIGFRHEHPWAPLQGGCGESPTIQGLDLTGRRVTDTYDQLSVMHYPQCGGLPGVEMTLSPLDGEGARTVYGIPSSWYVPIFG